MGLLKAALAAGGSVLADQWKEFFYCDSIPAGTLMVKGKKRVSAKSSNTKGSEDIITNGSVIAVADGQCMIIVDQGRVVEICAEPGEYTYDMSSEPSIFSGGLGHGIKESFKTFAKRVSFGGDTAHVQRIYYFNLKEMMDNKFGTQNPVPFRVVYKDSMYEELTGNLTVGIRCNGNYTYKIVDPILFYTNVCGNKAGDFARDPAFEQQLKSELLDALQPAFAAVSDMGVRYDQLALHNKEIKDALNEALAADWKNKRGIEIGNITINSATVSPADMKRIQDFEDEARRVKMNSNVNLAAGTLTQAQADAMKAAAGNQGGAMMGFMGMNMAQQAGGMNAQNLFAMGAQQQAMQQQMQAQQQVQQQPASIPAPAANSWTCTCGAVNTAKFCSECGSPKPAPAAGWTCSCGAVNQGKFCQECGAKKPAGAPLYKCDKCGWQPEDPAHPPKFCPECGDIFDDNDIQ